MRYARYALGEIVLVVVGILIALQINDWYQDRLERQTEFEYLISMKRDLTEDIRELRVAVDGNNHLLTGLDQTLQLLASPRDDDAWRRELYTLRERTDRLDYSLSISVSRSGKNFPESVVVP